MSGSKAKLKQQYPISKESEMMVLGCMLSDGNSLKVASEALADFDFSCSEHQIIFQVLQDAYKQGKPADVHLVCEELKRLAKLETIGGVAQVTSLAHYAGTSAYIEEYIEIVKSKAILRRMIEGAQLIEKRAFSEPSDVNVAVDEALQIFTKIAQNASSNEIIKIGEVLTGVKSRIATSSVLERLEERYHYFQREQKSMIAGVPTGFANIDDQTTLLEDSNLIIVAARPGMGKTAFALNIANHAITHDKAVGIISLEMGVDQLVDRFLSLRTGISGEAIKRGTFDAKQLEVLRKEAEKLQKTPLFFHDQGCHTISQVSAKARRLKEAYEIRLLIVDYLQLLGASKHSESRQYEVAEVSRGLKLLAMELQIPIICVSQLSRRVEDRENKRPLLSDLRDSGQVEQDADVVLFIYRQDYYKPNEKPGQAEIFTAKNRNGADFKGFFHFSRSSGKFSPLASSEPFETFTELETALPLAIAAARGKKNSWD